MNSNNPLAAKLETENDRELEDFCQLFQDSVRPTGDDSSGKDEDLFR
jgi:hypothetical protein